MTWVAEITADSPVLWARLAETRGASAADAAGGAAGTYVGAPSLNQPSLLNAAAGDRGIALDGRAQYVTFPDDARTDRGDQITIEALVMFTAYRDSAGAPAVIVDKGANAYIFRMANTVDGTLLFRRSGVQDLCTSTTRLALNVLYHVVARKNGATSSIRVNKVNVTSARANSTMTNNSNVFSIGVADVTTGPANGFFPGRIDEVIIYSTSLSDARVDAHYDAAFNVTTSTVVAGGTRMTAAATKIASVSATVRGGPRMTAGVTKRSTVSTNIAGAGTLRVRAGRLVAVTTTIAGAGDMATSARKVGIVSTRVQISIAGLRATVTKIGSVGARVAGGARVLFVTTSTKRGTDEPPAFLTINGPHLGLTVNAAPAHLTVNAAAAELALNPDASELTIHG